MVHDNFLQLSKKVTINLDKVIYVEWTERQGFSLHACVTYETGRHVYYAGQEAQNLKRWLGYNSDGRSANGD